jgi:hypothetical protein
VRALNERVQAGEQAIPALHETIDRVMTTGAKLAIQKRIIADMREIQPCSRASNGTARRSACSAPRFRAAHDFLICATMPAKRPNGRRRTRCADGDSTSARPDRRSCAAAARRGQREQAPA